MKVINGRFSNGERAALKEVISNDRVRSYRYDKKKSQLVNIATTYTVNETVSKTMEILRSQNGNVSTDSVWIVSSIILPEEGLKDLRRVGLRKLAEPENYVEGKRKIARQGKMLYVQYPFKL